MARITTGIDVGSYGVRVIQGHASKVGFTMTAFHAEPREDLSALDALDETLHAVRLKPAPARIGVTGRDAMFRYLQVPDTGDAQLKKFVSFEIDELKQQSGGDIVGGFNLMHPPTLSDELVVLVSLAKASLLEEVVAQVRESKVRAHVFTPNAIGLFNAWLATEPDGDETVLIANLGRENVDVAIARGTDLYFARNLSGGTKFFLDAIQASFSIKSREKAEEILREACDLDPAHAGQLGSSTKEKVSQTLKSSAGQLSALLQSVATFAKAQAKVQDLTIDRVLLCGGGARIGGLPEYLTSAMGRPVERFDPFEDIDLASLSEDQFEALDEHRYEAVIALGLAMASADKDLYQLDIVPPSLERRQNLLQRTSWLVAAAVIALAYLILAYDRASSTAAVYDGARRVLARRVNAIVQTDQRADEAVTTFRETWQRSQVMEPWLQSGPALLSALEMVQAVLPEDFYIERVRLERARDGSSRDDDLPRAGRPIVYVGIDYLERGSDLSAQQKQLYEDGLLAPGRFTRDQVTVLQGGSRPARFKSQYVLRFDLFPEARETAE